MESRICYFLAVCRYGGFTAAARACGVRHSTVSRGVRQFERAVGGKLFERRRPLRLTALALRLRPMLEELHGLSVRIDRALETETSVANAGDGEAAD